MKRKTKRLIAIALAILVSMVLDPAPTVLGGLVVIEDKPKPPVDRPIVIGERPKVIEAEKKLVQQPPQKQVNTVAKSTPSVATQTKPSTTKQSTKTNGKSASELATTLITSHEGLRLVSYRDHKGYSIGYGTRSYAGEKITKQQARDRMLAIVSSMYNRVVRDFPTKKPNQYGALMSLMYNCTSCYN